MSDLALWMYEIQVAGQVNDSKLARMRADFGDDITCTAETVSTLVRGSVADQAALVGLLNRMHALGLSVCELRRLPDLDARIGPAEPSWPASLAPEAPST